MPTWIPIHEETARRILTFNGNDGEMLRVLKLMSEKGLLTTKLTDISAEGAPVALNEIDPFTFLANFNRGTKDANRRAMWRILKEEWSLESEVPADFDGVPVANSQNSWLMPYLKNRSADHVPLLWDFFDHIMCEASASLDTTLMERCLGLKQVGMTLLTMGMFWACPRKWISTDGKNIAFAETKGLSGKPGNAVEYKEWLPKINALIGGDAVEFSHQAHLWATKPEASYGSPFDIFFPDREPDRVLDYFAKVIGVLRETAEYPDELLSMTIRNQSGFRGFFRINIWMWAVTTCRSKRGHNVIEFLVPIEHEEAMRTIKWRAELGKPEKTGFAETPEGVRYTLARLEEPEFFERFEELWPVIEVGVRAISGLFSGRKSPFLRNHTPDLESLCMEADKREEILRKGIIRKPTLSVGSNRKIWLIAPGEGAKLWDEWTEEGIAAIGWHQIGNISAYATKDKIQVALEGVFPDKNQSSVALMLWNFCREMKGGDVVFAKLGRSEIVGWGIVGDGFAHDESRGSLPNIVPVEWMEQTAAKLSENRTLPIKSLTEITTDSELLKLLSAAYPEAPLPVPRVPGPIDPPPPPSTIYAMEDALAELFMSEQSLTHILEQLNRKKNIILQGAPGVGKTFIAKRLAWLMLGEKDDSAIESIQFHQSYSYEDFVQGLRPNKEGRFEVRDGCFYRLCRKALANPQQDHFIIIDEINRGNLSKILGELMMLIETDKRGEELTLAYSEEPFTVPPNLYIIGTMNTADRSLSLVDYALRRRFAFLTLDPGFGEKSFSAHLVKHGLEAAHIARVTSHMAALNAVIEDDANLGKGYRIGHSFFTPFLPVNDFEKWFSAIVRYEILPLIEEYWIDDPKTVEGFRISLTEESFR